LKRGVISNNWRIGGCKSARSPSLIGRFISKKGYCKPNDEKYLNARMDWIVVIREKKKTGNSVMGITA